MPFQTPPLPRKIAQHAHDIQGLAQLTVDGVLGVTRTAEHLHRSIAARAFPLGRGRGDSTTGLTGLIYRSVRGTTRLAGWVLQQGLGPLAGLLKTAASPGQPTPRREAIVAALNGIWGDTLEATGNPLAIPMALRVHGRPVVLQRERLATAFTRPSGRVLVMVHGLCMNDLQWTRKGHDHGQALADSLGMSVLYLHYNTGLPIACNGRQFANMLEQLLREWPVPVEQLSIVGHSMGGLVTRSACHFAEQLNHHWLTQLKTLAFLGTPHHGAPLEKGGHGVDTLLKLSPYLAPFARITLARSAGIADLRYGDIAERDSRQPTAMNHVLPLPQGVATHVVAAITSASPDAPQSRLLGDGLVPLASALGENTDPALCLDIPPHRKTILPTANHWDLLNRQEVYLVLLRALDESA